MHAGQQIRGLRIAHGNALVRVQLPGRGTIALPAVGDHGGALLDGVDEKGSQRVAGGVGKPGHPTTPVSAGLDALNGDRDECLLALRAPAGQAGLLTTMNVSSTSTGPCNSSRPGRTSTDRKRCSIAQAVW